MMTITQKTVFLDTPLDPTEKLLPGGMTYEEYELIMTAYTESISLVHPVSTPTLPVISYEYMLLCAKKLAEEIALEHLSDQKSYCIENEEDAKAVLSSVFCDFHENAVRRNYQWYITKALEIAGLCYVDSDVDCDPKACRSRDDCYIEFIILNSPQSNLVPVRGGVHVCGEYLRNPLKELEESSLYWRYTTHSASKETPYCMQEEFEEMFIAIEDEMFEVFDKIVKGAYTK